MSAIGGIVDFKNGEIDFSELERMRLAMSMRGRKRSSAYIGGQINMIFNSDSSKAFAADEDSMPAIFERSSGIYCLCLDSDDLNSSAVFEAYRSEGLDFLGRLTGDFSLALYDGDRKKLLLARDSKGKRPLFYRIYKGKIYFASEIKGIVEATGEVISVSREMLSLHITAPMGVYSSCDILTQIYEVGAGECLILTELGMSCIKYKCSSSRKIHEKASGERKCELLKPYAIEDTLRLDDTLAEALIAFDYPQFDSAMPSLCRMLDSAKRKGKERVLFEDEVLSQSLSYAFERSDRLCSVYGVRADGKRCRIKPSSCEDSLIMMHRHLCADLFSMNDGQIEFLRGVLGTQKLSFLMNRFKQGKTQKDTDAEIRILGMLIQTVMWAESRQLFIKGADGQSLLSMT